MRESIAEYLKINPRNKLFFIPTGISYLRPIDLGYEFALLIQKEYPSPFLPMIAEEKLNSLMNKSIKHDDIIGNYIAITNWGILFEPELKLNIQSFLESHSKNQALILINCGKIDSERFYLVDQSFNTVLDLNLLNPYYL